MTPTPHILRTQETAGQEPFTAGSRIATHSTWCVIGKVSTCTQGGQQQVRDALGARMSSAGPQERQVSVTASIGRHQNSGPSLLTAARSASTGTEPHADGVASADSCSGYAAGFSGQRGDIRHPDPLGPREASAQDTTVLLQLMPPINGFEFNRNRRTPSGGACPSPRNAQPAASARLLGAAVSLASNHPHPRISHMTGSRHRSGPTRDFPKVHPAEPKSVTMLVINTPRAWDGSATSRRLLEFMGTLLDGALGIDLYYGQAGGARVDAAAKQAGELAPAQCSVKAEQSLCPPGGGESVGDAQRLVGREPLRRLDHDGRQINTAARTHRDHIVVNAPSSCWSSVPS